MGLLVAPLVGTLAACSGVQLAGGNTSGNQSILTIVPTGPSPTQAIQWANNPYDADQRARGVGAVANATFGGQEIFVEELYRPYLEDDDAAVRAAAARALGRHGSPSDAIGLATLLRADEDTNVRQNAALGLQRVHNPEVIDELIQAISLDNEEDPAVRAAAADALGQYAERRVLDSLAATLDDPDLIVTHNALGSLRLLTGQDMTDDRREWVAWLRDADEPFAGRGIYEYPIFRRGKFWVEYLPFWPAPPNENPGTPTGLPITGETAPGSPDA